MRILVSTKPVADLPKAPYDGFFECVSFQWASALVAGPANLAPVGDARLLHPVDLLTNDLVDAWLLGTKLDFTVLYERPGSRGAFIYLRVGLAQATVARFEHRAVAGASPVPIEDLTIAPSAINGTFYDEGGREIGRTSIAMK